MRLSKLFIKTSKNDPSDETAKNAILLTRGGFIHKEMAGVYAYTPLGRIVLEKIKQIVREEMDNVGGQEVIMTTLQPRELWEKTDRWDDSKVDNWFKTKLRNDTEVGVGLTHDEPIVDLVSEYVNSYKDLPFCVYQIQNKFRNELRAKSGLLRGREFLMKDMYSFARTQEEHEQIYETIVDAYHKVYARIGIGDITYRTFADGGIFTNRLSDEFQTISPVGEDKIFVDEKQKLGINEEVMTDENLQKVGLKREDLVEKRAIEVGNTFHLETKYTDALDVYYVDEQGAQQKIIMGCYGIGVSRLMGVIAEIFSDEKGLVWPKAIAPATVYLATIGNDDSVIKMADDLYKTCQASNIGVIYDDRDVRPGEKFSDADLMGIPYRVVISPKTVDSGSFEVKERSSGNVSMLDAESMIKLLVQD